MDCWNPSGLPASDVGGRSRCAILLAASRPVKPPARWRKPGEAPGFLQLVPPGYEGTLRRNLARQQRPGVETREVSREEARAIFSRLRTHDIGAAAYEPGSGYADPNATAFAFAAAARRLGVTVETGCEVSRILTERGRVTGVETVRGRVQAPVVVVAPGAWGQPLRDPLGLDFGLQPYRIQVSLFWPPALTGKHPVVIDAGQKAWIRPVDDALILIGVELGAAYAGEPDKLHEEVDEGYVALCRERLSHRLPLFADSTMRGGWAGVIMMSPDGRAIIDRIPSVEGLFVMLGDFGTSFKTSPAIGRCLAEWVLAGKPRTVDLAPFRGSRFAEGKPWIDEDHDGRSG